jgi:hypothetical protein
MSGNKTKILRSIEINGGLTMDDLMNRHSLGQLTDQTRPAFKQMIYQLKHLGDINHDGVIYVNSEQGKDYLRESNNMPTTEPPAKPQLEACPECDRFVILDKHVCPNADPLIDDGEPETNHTQESCAQAIAEMDEPHDDSADFEPPEDPEPDMQTENIPPHVPSDAESDIAATKALLQSAPPTTTSDIYIKLPNVDNEIDCMTALVMVMTHFETRDMPKDARLRVSRWFEDKYNPEMRPPQ